MTRMLKSSAPSQVATPSKSSAPAWHAAFLEMLPKIQEHARFRFRHLPRDQREEVVQEAVANACAAYARLVERGSADSATWSSLAKYAIRQVRQGRRVGGSLNKRDVSSCYCQQHIGVRIENLYRWDDEEQDWQEMILEDRQWAPADVAAFRIDFGEFLGSLSRRNQKLALDLAKGHATSWVAQNFRVSAGRISQIRLELFTAWQEFQAEPVVG